MGDDIKDTIITNIRAAMRARGVRQVDIARHMGVSPASVSAWLAGSNLMTIDNLATLCDYLQINLNQVTGYEPMPIDIIDGDEARLIRAYRAADPIYRTVAIEIMEAHPDAKNKKSLA